MMNTFEVAESEPIPVDTHADESDRESAYGGSDASVYTESLRSSLLESLKENGRGYHKYRSEVNYIVPEDKREQDRLDLQHGLFLLSFDDQLIIAPIPEKLDHVLDVGTGTGIWAIDFADQHPEANVVGTDLSSIQPSWVPPNCKFEVDDFDEEWTFKQKFSLIHGRMISPFSNDFKKMFQRCYDAIEDGGWFELQDVYLPILSDDDTLNGTEFEKWIELFMEACRRIGRDPQWPAKYKDALTEVGFEGVTEKIYKWPTNSWPKDKKMKEIGQWNLINMLDGLEGFTFRLWTSVLGWTVEETESFLTGVRRDVQDRKIHAYWRIHVVYGQKGTKKS